MLYFIRIISKGIQVRISISKGIQLHVILFLISEDSRIIIVHKYKGIEELQWSKLKIQYLKI